METKQRKPITELKVTGYQVLGWLPPHISPSGIKRPMVRIRCNHCGHQQGARLDWLKKTGWRCRNCGAVPGRKSDGKA